jgi:hypothetical protein
MVDNANRDVSMYIELFNTLSPPVKRHVAVATRYPLLLFQGLAEGFVVAASAALPGRIRQQQVFKRSSVYSELIA